MQHRVKAWNAGAAMISHGATEAQRGLQRQVALTRLQCAQMPRLVFQALQRTFYAPVSLHDFA